MEFKKIEDDYRPIKILIGIFIILNLLIILIFNLEVLIALIFSELFIFGFFQAIRFRYCPNCLAKMKFKQKFENYGICYICDNCKLYIRTGIEFGA